MLNCVILGSGRSGTSLVAGSLAASGYRTGERLWNPTEANPLGFHEDKEVNSINERLLAPMTPLVLPGRLGRLTPSKMTYLRRWLAVVDDAQSVTATRGLNRRISAAVKQQPFALKDPRFCVTLPAWERHLPERTVRVVVFRDPQRTIESLEREVQSAPYLRGLELERAHLERLWQQSYSRVLAMRARLPDERWCFVHYDQVLSGKGLVTLGNAVESDLSDQFIEPSLARSVGSGAVTITSTRIYDELCELANHGSPPVAPSLQSDGAASRTGVDS